MRWVTREEMRVRSKSPTIRMDDDDDDDDEDDDDDDVWHERHDTTTTPRRGRVAGDVGWMTPNVRLLG